MTFLTLPDSRKLVRRVSVALSTNSGDMEFHPIRNGTPRPSTFLPFPRWNYVYLSHRPTHKRSGHSANHPTPGHASARLKSWPLPTQKLSNLLHLRFTLRLKLLRRLRLSQSILGTSQRTICLPQQTMGHIVPRVHGLRM